MIEYQHCTYCSKCEMRLDFCKCGKAMNDDEIGAKFDEMLNHLKANNPDFDKHVERGKLMMSKREEDLTDTERAFLNGDTAELN